MKIPMKYHNHKAHPSRVTKRRVDENNNEKKKKKKKKNDNIKSPAHEQRTVEKNPANILYKSIAGQYRPSVKITSRYRFIKNTYWEPTALKRSAENLLGFLTDAKHRP